MFYSRSSYYWLLFLLPITFPPREKKREQPPQFTAPDKSGSWRGQCALFGVEGLKASSSSIFSCSRAAARATNAGTNIVRPEGWGKFVRFIYERSSKYGRLYSESPRFRSLALARRSMVSDDAADMEMGKPVADGNQPARAPPRGRLIILVVMRLYGCQRKRLVERIDGSGCWASPPAERNSSAFSPAASSSAGNPALHDTTRDSISRTGWPPPGDTCDSSPVGRGAAGMRERASFRGSLPRRPETLCRRKSSGTRVVPR